MRCCRINVTTGYFRILHLTYRTDTVRTIVAGTDPDILHFHILEIIHRCTVTATGAAGCHSRYISSSFHEDSERHLRTVCCGQVLVTYLDILVGVLINSSTDTTNIGIAFDMET